MARKTLIGLLVLVVVGLVAIVTADETKKDPSAVKKAPLFTLENYDGAKISLADYKGKIIVLEWFNYECPFVVYHYETKPTMRQLAQKYKDKNVVWLAMNSTSHQQVEMNKDFASKHKVPYPILDDRSGKTGRAYKAERTPHMYVIDAEGNIVYSGAIDNAPMGNKPADAEYANYVDKALAELTSEKEVTTKHTKPYGCTVKYAK